MEVSWFPTVLNMLGDIPDKCPIVKDIVRDILVGQLLKDLQSLQLTFWLLRDMCFTDKSSFLSPLGSGKDNPSIYN